MKEHKNDNEPHFEWLFSQWYKGAENQATEALLKWFCYSTSSAQRQFLRGRKVAGHIQDQRSRRRLLPEPSALGGLQFRAARLRGIAGILGHAVLQASGASG